MANSPQSFQLHTRAFYDRMRREFYSSNNEPIHAEIFHAMNRLVGAKARKYFPPERNFCCYSDAVADVTGKFFTVTIHDYLSDEFAESHPTDNLRLAYLHCAVRNALIDIYRAERARGNVSHAEPEDNSAPRRIMNVSLNKALPNGGELGDLIEDRSEDFTKLLEQCEDCSEALERILLNSRSSPDKRVTVVYSLLRGRSHNRTVEGNLLELSSNILNEKTLDACLDLVYDELKACHYNCDMVNTLRAQLTDEQLCAPMQTTSDSVRKWRNTNLSIFRQSCGNGRADETRKE